MQSVESQPTFRRNISSESSSKKLVLSGERAKQASLVACYVVLYCMAYSSTLKMEMTCFSETSVDFKRIPLNLIINSL
jgi:hypothetical protein